MNGILLATSVADGFEQMALDMALLDHVASHPEPVAYLRFYGWSEPTLSLGYFQEYRRAIADPRWSAVPIVRRPSGGGAIWHDRDLTYALILPAEHPLGRRPDDLYRQVHRSVIAALRELGLAATLRGGDRPRGDHPYLCFLDGEPTDVVASGTKIVGSAQRRKSGALLQHGSILLGTPPEIPGLIGIGDLLGVPTDRMAMADRLARAIPRGLGLEIGPGELPDGLGSRQADFASRFRDRTWQRRR